ncbi:MAG: MarR family winged helix-turn-helix transcriptional regulator [Acidimicrobiales bacterium]
MTAQAAPEVPSATPAHTEASSRPGRARSVPDELARELLFSFARMARGPKRAGAMPKHIEELVGSGVLAPRHLGAFAVISMEGPISISELAAREGFALSTTSLLVTQLAEVGLVERYEDDQDRRRTLVSIAPRYRRVSEEVLAAKLAPLRRAVARMGAQRARALVEGLEMVAEEVTAGDETASACHSPRRREI